MVQAPIHQIIIKYQGWGDEYDRPCQNRRRNCLQDTLGCSNLLFRNYTGAFPCLCDFTTRCKPKYEEQTEFNSIDVVNTQGWRPAHVINLMLMESSHTHHVYEALWFHIINICFFLLLSFLFQRRSVQDWTCAQLLEVVLW